ncbi:MAG: response regulator [Parcubacteria group bacterium]|nr:response regulator [Parcubacteria group bacterium]
MTKRILIIEDEHLLAEMYVTRFAREGFKVSIAKTVAKGIELAKKEKPHLILLDILLPDENGIAFLIIKQSEKSIARIPVVAFSNFDDPEIKKQALALGALEYLRKTDYTPQELVEKVRSYVK